MSTLRDLRQATQSSQAVFAERLGVSLESYRMWDSGRREPPTAVMTHARALAARGSEQKSLALLVLAPLLGVSVFRLREAARDGRLAVTYEQRVAFGRRIPRATLAAGQAYKRQYYGTRARWVPRPIPQPVVKVPADYDRFIVRLRRRLSLSQAQLAIRIGAAGKAVVYQWESRKRTPSPPLWQKLMDLDSM
jgi:DNA-binding transcriptional regulator YiaG